MVVATINGFAEAETGAACSTGHSRKKAGSRNGQMRQVFFIS